MKDEAGVRPGLPDAVVLAGGLGTRLQGVGWDGPKPMAPVCGRPFLEYVLDHLAASGTRRVILSVCHKKEQIRAHFDATYAGLELEYSVEQIPLGTGGAIARACRMVRTDYALVLNGDTLFRVDLGDFVTRTVNGGLALAIALKPLADAGRYGAVELSAGRVVGFREKGASRPGLINGGIYILGPEARSFFPAREVFSFEKDVLEPAARTGQIAGYVSDAYFIDIGVPEDYRRAQEDLRSACPAPR